MPESMHIEGNSRDHTNIYGVMPVKYYIGDVVPVKYYKTRDCHTNSRNIVVPVAWGGRANKLLHDLRQS